MQRHGPSALAGTWSLSQSRRSRLSGFTFKAEACHLATSVSFVGTLFFLVFSEARCPRGPVLSSQHKGAAVRSHRLSAFCSGPEQTAAHSGPWGLVLPISPGFSRLFQAPGPLPEAAQQELMGRCAPAADSSSEQMGQTADSVAHFPPLCHPRITP